jgi:hypothetical protein
MNNLDETLSIQQLPIILIQWTQSNWSKTYYYFNSRQEGIKFILKLYEDSLNNNFKNVKVIQMSQVLSFIYSFYDFVYLELDEVGSVYKSYGKDWFSDILINSVKSINL